MTARFPDEPAFQGRFAPAQLTRWTIDTAAPPDLGDGTTAFGQRRLTGRSGEFPRTDDRWATRGYRFGLINLTDVPGLHGNWVTEQQLAQRAG
jgi:carotenoid cleavage dioxygenase-like enzyme